MFNWEGLDPIGQVFFIIAIASTAILALQLILNMLGLAGHDADIGAGDHEIPADGDAAGGDAHSSGLGILSVRTIVAFFVGFGWAGIATLRSGGSTAAAIAIAFGAGLVFMFTVFYVMKLIFRLSESGNIDFKNAVGQSGTVYTTIPAKGGGAGRIQLVVQGRMREMDAVTESESVLSPGMPITVEKFISGSTVLVKKLEVK